MMPSKWYKYKKRFGNFKPNFAPEQNNTELLTYNPTEIASAQENEEEPEDTGVTRNYTTKEQREPQPFQKNKGNQMSRSIHLVYGGKIWRKIDRLLKKDFIRKMGSFWDHQVLECHCICIFFREILKNWCSNKKLQEHIKRKGA